MKHSYFVDYHFHPNFRFRGNVVRRGSRIWEAFERHGLDVVIATEHSWKRPGESFELLQALRPAGARTRLMPGAELLTREGLDVVVFGLDPRWYLDSDLSRLLVPYGVGMEEALDVLDATRLPMAGFLPHPYTRGTTGAVQHFGRRGAQEVACRLGGLEVSNNCYDDCLRLTDPLGTRILPHTYDRMRRTQSLDRPFLEAAGVRFLAHGSDAHFPEELGYGCLVEGSGTDQVDAESAFALLTGNENPVSECRASKGRLSRVMHVSRSAAITMHEAWQKKQIRKGRRSGEEPGTALEWVEAAS